MEQPPPPDREPGERPNGARKLDTPPSVRYGPGPGSTSGSTSEDPTNGRGPATSPSAARARALVLAALASLVGAAVIVVLAGILGQTAGLLAAVALTGVVIGRMLRGAGLQLSASVRLVAALILVVGAVALGNFGTWAYALSEGGVLGPIDYLLETFGPLVPIEFVVGGTAAILASR